MTARINFLESFAHHFLNIFFIFFGTFTALTMSAYFLGLNFINLAYLTLFSLPVLFLIYRWIQPTLTYPIENTSKEHWTLLLFILFAIFLTCCLKRPDRDDQLYLGISVMVLDRPSTALNHLPFGRYVFSAHEYLKALFSLITRIPLLSSFYLVIPSIMTFLVITIHWKLSKLFTPKYWQLSILMLLVVFLAWGDAHRTHANFGLVRLFQGKGCLVSLVIPAIFYYYSKYRITNARIYLLLMLFTALSGVGFSPTAIIICPLLLVLLTLADFLTDIKQIRKYYPILLIILIPIMIGLFYRYGLHYNYQYKKSPTNLEMLNHVLGSNYRGYFTLFCLAISPFFVYSPALKKFYRNFVIILIIMIAIPNTSEIIAKTTYKSASWRWLWIIPFPFIISFVTTSLYETVRQRSLIGSKLLITILVAAYILAPGRHVLSERNNTSFSLFSYKLNGQSFYLRPYKAEAIIEDGYIYPYPGSKGF